MSRDEKYFKQVNNLLLGIKEEFNLSKFELSTFCKIYKFKKAKNYLNQRNVLLYGIYSWFRFSLSKISILCNKYNIKLKKTQLSLIIKKMRINFNNEEYDNEKELIIRKKVISNRLNKYVKERRKWDKEFVISQRLRVSFYRALKHYTKTGKIKSSNKYGIDYKAIIEHLKPFPKDIHLYHVDHIKPLCSFNLEVPEQIKLAFAPSNLQWLLAKDNLKKGGRF